MIRVYYLTSSLIDGVNTLAGIEHIHGAILELHDILWKLIQDVTQAEHDGLASVAFSWRLATQVETDQLQALPSPEPLNPDAVRVAELLATSPSVITMPEIWELLRIYARRLGFHS